MQNGRRQWGLVAAALALAVGAGCSSMKSAAGMDKGPTFSAARLEGIPDSQLGEVKSAQTELDRAKQTQDQAKKDAENVASRLEYAKSNKDLAEAEVKAAKSKAEVGTQEMQGGAEQRAAQEGSGEMSDLRAAELKAAAAKSRVDYLASLENYAKSREDVAAKIVDESQAKLTAAQYDALAKARPQEAAALKEKPVEFQKAVTEKEAKLTEARSEQEKSRAKAISSYSSWNQAYQQMRDQDRGEQPPAPDTLPPL